ncbi:MAG TPA: NAD(P)/FAD-dependent oxidoreductase [Gaiellaceae bacterium]|nr:NAD(P)/FAD-dependent oxidoreductase [Gaiellaceae bacterium]
MPDAVVIGAGPNGLVAANLLADAGWSVEVLEEQPEPGGAVKSGEHVEPGFVSDAFSAFYPLAAASPVVQRLELQRYGLRWRHGPLVLAHPAADGSCAVLSRDLAETAASLERFAPGDGEAWRGLFARYDAIEQPFLRALTTPFPPVRAGLSIALRLRRDLVDFARFAVLPVRRMGDEHFAGAGGRRLLAGNALHADLLPESPVSGFFGWFLCCLGQTVGYPVPEGGAGKLTEALVRRLEASGGRVTCGARVTEIVVRGGRAEGVRSTAGDVTATKAVLADVHAVALYLELLRREHVPPRVLDGIRKMELDPATFKLDWTLDAPIPWAAEEARRAPVIHVTESVDELSVTASELARKLVPTDPFLVLGQYATADPTRSPAGKDTAWAYTHLPQAVDPGDLAARMEARIEALAPGFRDLIRRRHVWTPTALEQANRNLRGGALNGGTAQIHQQLVFRPIPGLGRPETPIRGLYLCSSSAHPGGGVHGGPGAIAARAALRKPRLRP